MRKKITFVLTVIFTFIATVVTAQNDLYNNILSKGYEIIHIENDGVKQFIDDRSYDNPGLVNNYNYSVVTKYSKGNPPRPAGITLRWDSPTPVEEIATVMVTLVESDIERDGALLDENLTDDNAKFYYPDISKKEYLLCNMRPNKYCYYKIEELLKNGRRTILQTGQF